MTQEEKSLLLKDLCVRLPYGVKCIVEGLDNCTLMPSDIEEEREIKPYLRPMSSMTEEEWKEYRDINCCLTKDCDAWDEVDWLNSHHFDYRGLIEKNLAIDCTNLNIY